MLVRKDCCQRLFPAHIGEYVKRIRSTAKQYQQMKSQPFKENALSTIFNDTHDTIVQLKECREECQNLRKARDSDKRQYNKLLQAAADQIKILHSKLKEKSISRQRDYDLDRQKSSLSRQSHNLQKKQSHQNILLQSQKAELQSTYQHHYNQLQAFYQTLQQSIIQQHQLQIQQLEQQNASLSARLQRELEEARVKESKMEEMFEGYEREVEELNVVIEETKVMLGRGRGVNVGVGVQVGEIDEVDEADQVDEADELDSKADIDIEKEDKSQQKAFPTYHKKHPHIHIERPFTYNF